MQILATNKLASICGTSVAAATYYRRVRPDPRTFVPADGAARSLGSPGRGALVASHIPRSAFDPIVLVVLVRGRRLRRAAPRSSGERTALRFTGHRHTGAAMLTGAAIGFYDGALGPGTGSFFVFALVGLLGYSFVEGVRQGPAGELGDQPRRAVRLRPAGRGAVACLGLVMGLANLAGGYVGARTAVSRGSRFVRVFFLVVVGRRSWSASAGRCWARGDPLPDRRPRRRGGDRGRSGRGSCARSRGSRTRRPPGPSSSGSAASTGTARHHCSAFVLGPDGGGPAVQRRRRAVRAPRARRCWRCCAAAR